MRIAGVRVGQVDASGWPRGPTGRWPSSSSRSAQRRAAAGGVEATIRYRNLVGQRYIALTEGEGSGGETLDEGATSSRWRRPRPPWT